MKPDVGLSFYVRLGVALVVAIAAGWWTDAKIMGPPAARAGDFIYAHVAARAVIHGTNPYEAVRHSPEIPKAVPVLLYPLPVALVALPLAGLSPHAAAVLFVAIGTGIFAFLVTRESLWMLFLLVSAPATQVYITGQWSALLTAGALAPALLGLIAVKPNFALPLFAYQRSPRSILIGLVGVFALVAVSFALQPGWLGEWLRTVRGERASASYRLPIATPLGAILVLCLLRWRTREGRLLFCMAVSPQHGFFYGQFPLLLVARSRLDALSLAAASQVAIRLYDAGERPSLDPVVQSNRFYPYMVAGVYLPALLVVLLRPNEGAIPAWLERFVVRWPRAIRGATRLDGA